VENNLVGITFFNSELDRDLFKIFYVKTFIFFCYEPPSNYYGDVDLINTCEFEELNRKTVFLQSRLVKFFPWRYIQDYENFVYSDYRIDVHRIFFSDIEPSNFPLFLRHREEGVYLDELLRNIDRNRISSEIFLHINNLVCAKFDLPISENGVLCLKKSDYMSFDEFQREIYIIQRDQLVVPALIKIPMSYWQYNLNNLKYFHVNSKKFSVKNFLKRLFSFFYSRI